jgi:hypothetical protein
MAVERCEVCGANVALVGRSHNCRPRPRADAVETKPETKPRPHKASGLVSPNKRGRPSLGAPWKALGISRASYFRRRAHGAQR